MTATHSGIDWTDAFDNSGYVPGSDALVANFATQAAAFRDDLSARARARLNLAYGDAPRNRMDLFLPEGAARGLVVFVHGGYWHRLDNSFWSHLAAGPLASGWAVAMPSYTLAPEARISRITTEIAAAIRFAAGHVDGPVRLIGHSAGGHLVSRMICAATPLQGDVAGRIAHTVSLSGVHDLRPLLLAAMNETLQLDAAEAATESPALLAPSQSPATFWVGAAERPEFLRQTRLITEAWQSHGAPVRDVYEPEMNHFTVVRALGQPGSPLLQTLLGETT
ncbi:alpha/beta hydrolase [Seohaeicola saemankumensis]|nr:alpha/beta hydrolase [Seohaeicola saemankumensis]MCA0873249.1 alpha/beta hydrolase [Seohaeicola saemankumensis]